MLTIKYINPTGMFSWGKVPNVDVEECGLINLMGVNEDKGDDSNGAGKSSLFNALCEILFGENPTGVSGNDVINQVMDAGFAGRVEFIAEDGSHYRVTYCRKWKENYYPVDNDTKVAYKGSSPALFLDKFDGNEWKDARGAKMGETRKILSEILGISYSRFLSIAYLSPRVGSQFLRGTNKERVDILAGVTGVEEWDLILVNARTKKSSMQREMAEVQQQIAYEEGALAQLQARLEAVNPTEINALIATYEADLVKLRTELIQLQEALAASDANVQQLSEAQAVAYDKTGAGTLSQEISDLAVQEGALRNPAFVDDSLPQFDPVLTQNVETKKSEVDAQRGAMRMYTTGADIRKMEQCPTCKSPITTEMKQAIQDQVDSMSATLDTLEAQLNEAQLTKTIQEEKVRNAREERYGERLKEADGLHTQAEEKRALLQQSTVEYERLSGEIRTANGARQAQQTELNAVQQRINSLEIQLKGAQNQLKEAVSLEQEIGEKQRMVKTLQTDIAGDLQDVAVLEWLISNIPYIKLHRMSVAMVQLSEGVNRYLADMGDTLKVNISSFREKKSAKGAADSKDALKSEIHVEVVDGQKNIDPRLYSDGETAKISNALIRALHDVAMQAGHGCNLILLDEIFSFVDLNNSQRLAESFRNVVKGTALVTDNSGYVNDLMEFNGVWTARKNGGMTTLEMEQT